MLNKYKIEDRLVLIYGDNLHLEDNSSITLVEENVSIQENEDLPIYNGSPEDRKLFAENISTFNDIKNAYFLIKTKELNKPKAIRNLVLKRYEDLSNYF